MAKIQTLEVDTIKIGENAVTSFFTRSSTTSITVDNPYGIPTFIWLNTFSAVTLTRASDGKVIFSAAAAVTMYVVDDDPPASATTYNASVSEIVGAMVSLR